MWSSSFDEYSLPEFVHIKYINGTVNWRRIEHAFQYGSLIPTYLNLSLTPGNKRTVAELLTEIIVSQTRKNAIVCTKRK